MARGTDDVASDVDVLLRFSEPKSLLAIVRLERELSEALDRRLLF
jgi:predicted nucleotidyltransferase